jgi:Fic-DOC domain mobile mystery protein B
MTGVPVTFILGDLLPGETPIEDCSGLKVKGITTRRQLSEAEAENIRKVLVRYLADAPSRELASFDFSWVLTLHREMFGDVWDWAGQCRTQDLNFGCHWLQINEKLYNLLEDLKFWEYQNLDLMEQVARLHHGAVAIHPFLNGNGRWARMLTNIWLKLHESAHVAWPEHLIGNASPIRGGYIEALKAADNGDYAALIELHRRFIPTPPRPIVAQQPETPSMLEPGRVIQSKESPHLPPAHPSP